MESEDDNPDKPSAPTPFDEDWNPLSGRMAEENQQTICQKYGSCLFVLILLSMYVAFGALAGLCLYIGRMPWVRGWESLLDFYYSLSMENVGNYILGRDLVYYERPE